MNQKLSADNNSPHPSVNVICTKRILRPDRGDESSQRVYPVECEQHKTGAQEYDGLVYLAISDALNPKRRECLAVCQKIIDGDNTQDHRTHAGCYVYIHRGGALCVEGGIVHKETVKAAIEKASTQSTASNLLTIYGGASSHPAACSSDKAETGA